MTCRLCKDRGKTWEGSDPRCAFLETTELMTTENELRSAKVFSGDNWNCATMNKLRDIARDLPLYWRNDDFGTFGAVPFEGEYWQGYIAMAWYKRRGRTNQAMLMGDGDMPLPLTEEMALEAIRYWEARRSGKAR